MIVTPYPGLERLPGAASCSTFHSLGGPLEWGAVNARFYPSPLFPESVSSVGCLFPPTADAQGTTSHPLQERLSQRKRHRPSFPTLSSASPGPFGGFPSHLHRTEWGMKIVLSDPRSQPLAEKHDLRKQWLVWLRANSQHPGLGGLQLGVKLQFCG